MATSEVGLFELRSQTMWMVTKTKELEKVEAVILLKCPLEWPPIESVPARAPGMASELVTVFPPNHSHWIVNQSSD